MLLLAGSLEKNERFGGRAKKNKNKRGITSMSKTSKAYPSMEYEKGFVGFFFSYIKKYFLGGVLILGL